MQNSLPSKCTRPPMTQMTNLRTNFMETCSGRLRQHPDKMYYELWRGPRMPKSVRAMKDGRRWWDGMDLEERTRTERDLRRSVATTTWWLKSIYSSIETFIRLRWPPRMQAIGRMSTISSSMVDTEVRWWTREQWEGLMPTQTITWR